MKDYDTNKKSSYLKYWYVSNLYGWTLLQKLPVDGLYWVKNKSQFNEDFIKSYREYTDEGYFLEADVPYP